MHHIDDGLQRIASAYFAGRGLALLFDFDGTLSPLVTHPDLATCDDATQEVLSALSHLPRVTVGIISARALADLKSKIFLPKLVYAGTCGLEIEQGGVSTENTRARRCAPLLQAVAELVLPAIQGYPGAWIEQKPLSFAIHFRQISRDEVPFLKQSVACALKRFEASLVLLEGSMAMEVLPDVGWTKGDALDLVVRQGNKSAFPLYAGNDANDADAMKAALVYGGITIGIGPHAPRSAQHVLPDVEALSDLLRRLFALLSRSQPLVHNSL